MNPWESPPLLSFECIACGTKGGPYLKGKHCLNDIIFCCQACYDKHGYDAIRAMDGAVDRRGWHDDWFVIPLGLPILAVCGPGAIAGWLAENVGWWAALLFCAMLFAA